MDIDSENKLNHSKVDTLDVLNNIYTALAVNSPAF